MRGLQPNRTPLFQPGVEPEPPPEIVPDPLARRASLPLPLHSEPVDPRALEPGIEQRIFTLLERAFPKLPDRYVAELLCSTALTRWAHERVRRTIWSWTRLLGYDSRRLLRIVCECRVDVLPFTRRHVPSCERFDLFRWKDYQANDPQLRAGMFSATCARHVVLLSEPMLEAALAMPGLNGQDLALLMENYVLGLGFGVEDALEGALIKARPGGPFPPSIHPNYGVSFNTQKWRDAILESDALGIQVFAMLADLPRMSIQPGGFFSAAAARKAYAKIMSKGPTLSASDHVALLEQVCRTPAMSVHLGAHALRMDLQHVKRDRLRELYRSGSKRLASDRGVERVPKRPRRESAYRYR